ncbi:MAG: type II toxin-antitoxin system RelE/ParE family toxin [Firmicutes bacterium]|jgi:mRNA interferase RelE/StbE|nr:type II toxin-antitoxin system RelE/ParE family toxin [Bacillota bacterium]
MKYQVEFSQHALKQLKKLDKYTASIIISYVKKKLLNTDNPRQFGKALQGNHSDKWRYRVGNYRLLAKIEDEKILIIIVEIGHRKDIYK